MKPKPQPRPRRAVNLSIALVLVGLLLASCAPTSTSSRQAASTTGGDTTPRAPKALRVGMQSQQEPTDGIVPMTGPGTSGGSGALEHVLTFHANLTIYDAQQTLLPHLAVQVPSLDDGTWQAFPDGRMELTWKLRPNLLWHDGTPLRAADFVFGTEVARDPNSVGTPPALGTKLLTEVLAPDNQTLVVRYPQPFVDANLGVNTPPLPIHILQDAYLHGDRALFENHPYWTSEFVGLGPYRLAKWERGSFIEAQAFDGYFLGRPKIDRIILRYYGDANTMIASLLADDVDVLPAGAQIDPSLLTLIRDAWGSTDKGTIVPLPKGTRNIIPQMRDANAPWVRDVRLRQMLAHALDRQLIVDTLQDGWTTPAHTSLSPNEPAYRLLEQRGLAKYTYDPARAERLLTDAGWARGSNRTFQNAAGQPFTITVTASNQPKNVKEAETVASMWSTMGLQSIPTPYPAAASNRDELKNTYQGAFIWPASSLAGSLDALSSDSIASERTRWKGNNYGGYTNPAFDRLLADFGTTLHPEKSQGLIADMMKIAADEAAVIPIYYVNLGLAFRSGITGPGGVAPNQAANAWNIHTWDVRL